MKHAPALALALLTGCAAATGPTASAPTASGPAPGALAAGGESGPPIAATSPRADPPGSGAGRDLAAVAAAMVELDDAARRGTGAALRARWSTAAADAPDEPVPAFLATYARPHDEETWTAFHALGERFQNSTLGLVGECAIYLEWGVLDQVDRTVAAGLAADRSDWLLSLEQARADELRGRLDAAAAGYRTVLLLDGADVLAHDGLARLAARAGDAATATREAEGVLASHPGHAPALEVLAGLATAAGRREQALRYARELVAASPRDRPARVALARLLEARGDAAGARDQWRAAVDLGEDPEGLLALAAAARAAGDAPTEQRALEHLAQLDPSADEWRRIAALRSAAGDRPGASQALRRVLAKDPRDRQASLELGRLLVAEGQTQEAVGVLREAGDAASADRAALERRLNIEPTARADAAGLERAVGALIERTYRQRLAELPRLGGNLTLRVTVDATGRGSVVEVVADSVHDPDVLACAYWNLRDAAYPTDKPGRYSFRFALRPPR